MNCLSSMFVPCLSSMLIKGGNIPKHIAFIMDGNRRYAKKYYLKEGHTDGTETLLQIIKWSIKLKVEELTVFAFSIDNFNRAEEEINLLENLFQKNFKKYSISGETKKLGLKICIYGNWSFFSEEDQKSFKQIEEVTKDNSIIKLNVCVGYNSTEEIYQAKSKMTSSSINDNENCIKEFESKLYGGYNCNPELLVRTSGETRLSNFLLYQCRFSKIIFINKYWPELNFIDYFFILLRYSREYSKHIKKIKRLEKDNCFSILSKDN